MPLSPSKIFSRILTTYNFKKDRPCKNRISINVIESNSNYQWKSNSLIIDSNSSFQTSRTLWLNIHIRGYRTISSLANKLLGERLKILRTIWVAHQKDNLRSIRAYHLDNKVNNSLSVETLWIIMSRSSQPSGIN